MNWNTSSRMSYDVILADRKYFVMDIIRRHKDKGRVNLYIVSVELCCSIQVSAINATVREVGGGGGGCSVCVCVCVCACVCVCGGGGGAQCFRGPC